MTAPERTPPDGGSPHSRPPAAGVQVQPHVERNGSAGPGRTQAQVSEGRASPLDARPKDEPVRHRTPFGYRRSRGLP
ncbi:hypothetical protein [Caldimonas brevitalea]|uniref:Uncharacterized protein n=1 Tax=Caldimonas brevitalea TaxID=413882 RepID=A0A0G3BGZ0_9BURK|nr:hypothetical protein [Caldimonas brevitalea]AKJ28607.1 hypothetical protein AAW51_1916 [Caldimonas brevitalea]